MEWDLTAGGAQIPRWRCHKEVSAFKIGAIQAEAGILFPTEMLWAPVKVSPAYLHKHQPQVGGYYVRYDDGYESFSPAKAFEDGYTRIDDSVKE